jgi:hypothetical protein
MQMLRRAQSFVTPLLPNPARQIELRRYVSRRGGRGGSTAPTQRHGCAVDTILVSQIAKLGHVVLADTLQAIRSKQ